MNVLPSLVAESQPTRPVQPGYGTLHRWTPCPSQIAQQRHRSIRLESNMDLYVDVANVAEGPLAGWVAQARVF